MWVYILYTHLVGIGNSEHDRNMEKTAPDREESSDLDKYIIVDVSQALGVEIVTVSQ